MKPGEAGKRPSSGFWPLGLLSFLRICHFSKRTQASYARSFSPPVHEIQLVYGTSRPVDTSELVHLSRPPIFVICPFFVPMLSHLGLTVFWSGTFAHIVFPTFSRFCNINHNALQLVYLDEIRIPTGHFLLSPSLFSIKPFCPTRASVGKLHLLLMIILPRISPADQQLS